MNIITLLLAQLVVIGATLYACRHTGPDKPPRHCDCGCEIVQLGSTCRYCGGER